MQLVFRVVCGPKLYLPLQSVLCLVLEISRDLQDFFQIQIIVKISRNIHNYILIMISWAPSKQVQNHELLGDVEFVFLQQVKTEKKQTNKDSRLCISLFSSNFSGLNP